MSSKTSARFFLIIFSLAVITGFSYSILKAEDLKEKQYLLKNISTENQIYSKYRHEMIEDMDNENEKYKKEMELAKKQYYEILNTQQAAIQQHTKQVAVVSKRLVAVETYPTGKKKSKEVASADNNSSSNNSSSSGSGGSSSKGGSASPSSSSSNSGSNSSSGGSNSSGGGSSSSNPTPKAAATPTPKAAPSPTPTVKPKPTPVPSTKSS